MRRIDIRLNRAAHDCCTTEFDVFCVVEKMDQLSDDQIKNLARVCHETSQGLRKSMHKLDREWNKRMKAKLKGVG